MSETEHPLLLNDAMVRARRAGRKRQTRRPMKPQPEMVADRTTVPYRGNADGLFRLLERAGRKSPFGVPGDQLWLREAWLSWRWNDQMTPREMADRWGELDPRDYIGYRADNDIVRECRAGRLTMDGKARPSIHMPRWASRDSVLVKRVWAERVQDISEGDAIAEGVVGLEEMLATPDGRDAIAGPDSGLQSGMLGSPRLTFELLWDSIYAAPKRVPAKGPISHYVSYPWEDVQETREHKGKPWIVNGNPWVWACEVEEVKL